MNADTSAADFGTVEDDIVGLSAGCCQIVDVVWMGGGKGMMECFESLLVGVIHEHGEVSYPK